MNSFEHQYQIFSFFQYINILFLKILFYHPLQNARALIYWRWIITHCGERFYWLAHKSARRCPSHAMLLSALSLCGNWQVATVPSRAGKAGTVFNWITAAPGSAAGPTNETGFTFCAVLIELTRIQFLGSIFCMRNWTEYSSSRTWRLALESEGSCQMTSVGRQEYYFFPSLGIGKENEEHNYKRLRREDGVWLRLERNWKNMWQVTSLIS